MNLKLLTITFATIATTGLLSGAALAQTGGSTGSAGSAGTMGSGTATGTTTGTATTAPGAAQESGMGGSAAKQDPMTSNHKKAKKSHSKMHKSSTDTATEKAE